MAPPTSRAQFKQVCLRRLGYPVNKMNMADEQVEDRIDFALAKFRDYHFDGMTKTYVPVQLTDTDVTNRYVTVPDTILEVTDLFPLSSTIMGVGMWNVTYQLLLTSMDLFRSLDLTNYVTVFQGLQMMEQVLIGKQPIRFNRYDSKLYIDMNWDMVAAGSFLVYHAYVGMDPNVYTKIWADQWLTRYATAQIKQGLGEVLKKHDGIQLLGGVTFNGQKIFDEASEEIDKLDHELIYDYSAPFEIGIG